MKTIVQFIFLGPFAFIYGVVVTLRNKLYDWHIFRSTEFPLPVISVGNITVGGTGKTPHAEMLLAMLKNDMNTAVLSRGYRRRTKGFRYVESTDTATTVGDEPMQMKQKFPEITIAVDVNRVEGIRRLMNDEKTINAIILDDAFQYRKVRPALSIVLMDYNRLIYNDYLLPLGRLRDRRNQIRRADIVFITKCPTTLTPIAQRVLSKDINLLPYQQLYLTTFAYGEPKAVFEKKSEANAEWFNRKYDAAPILLTGIANPTPLVNYLTKEKQPPVVHLNFPDHHTFTKKDVEEINAEAQKNPHSIIYTTEKDAMRILETKGLAGDVCTRIFFIPIVVQFLSDGKQEHFQKFITDYVRKNKRNTILHTIR